jgi:hypothetical protein
MEVSPFGRDEGFASIRQNENELQTVGHADFPQDLEGLTFEWVMSTCDSDAFRKVLKMGSVSWCPSGPWIMRNCLRSLPKE